MKEKDSERESERVYVKMQTLFFISFNFTLSISEFIIFKSKISNTFNKSLIFLCTNQYRNECFGLTEGKKCCICD